MKTKISELAKQWVRAVRLAGKYEGVNHKIYVDNRNKANKLEKELIGLGFDFRSINRKEI